MSTPTGWIAIPSGPRAGAFLAPSTWIPLIFGAIGTMMVNPMVLEVVGFPRNFLQHGNVVRSGRRGGSGGSPMQMPCMFSEFGSSEF